MDSPLFVNWFVYSGNALFEDFIGAADTRPSMGEPETLEDGRLIITFTGFIRKN